MLEIACMLYNLAIIGITCYMCANYTEYSESLDEKKEIEELKGEL